MKDARKNARKRTRRLATSGILAAVGVVLLYLGALIDVLDLSVAVLASLVCVFAVLEMGGAWPWLIYLVISVLSLILLPQKSPAVVFAFFGGYYPILKAYYERLRPFPAWGCKLIHFNLFLALAVIAVKWILVLPDFFLTEGPLGILLLFLAGNVVFVLYDVALTHLISSYLRVFRAKLRIRDL